MNDSEQSVRVWMRRTIKVALANKVIEETDED
jgi:hypothetical protein